MQFDPLFCGVTALIGALWVASLLRVSSGKVPKTDDKDAEESANDR